MKSRSLDFIFQRGAFFALIVYAVLVLLLPGVNLRSVDWFFFPISIYGFILFIRVMNEQVPEHDEDGPRVLTEAMMRTFTLLRKEAIPLFVLGALSFWESYQNNPGDYFVYSSLAVALGSIVLNVGIGNLARLACVSQTRFLVSFLVLEVALRLIQHEASFENWARVDAFGVLIKVCAMVCWGLTIESHWKQGLAACGIRDEVLRGINRSSNLDRDFLLHLKKVVPRSSYWFAIMPLVIVLSSATLWMVNMSNQMRMLLVLYGLPLLTGWISIVLVGIDYGRGLRKLLTTGILSELLLTPLRSPEILISILKKGLAPLVCTMIIVVSLQAIFLIFHPNIDWSFSLQTGLNPLFINSYGGAFGSLFILPIVWVLITVFLAGPQMKSSMTYKSVGMGELRVFLELLGMELLAIGLGFYSLIQSASDEGSVFVFLAPQVILIAWSYACWQQMMRDFSNRAHNIYEFETTKKAPINTRQEAKEA